MERGASLRMNAKKSWNAKHCFACWDQGLAEQCSALRTIHARRSLIAAKMSAIDFGLRLRADVAFAMQTDGNISRFHVAADDEHRGFLLLYGPSRNRKK